MADKCVHGKLVDWEICSQCNEENQTRMEIKDQGIVLSSILKELREIKQLLSKEANIESPAMEHHRKMGEEE